MHLGFKEKVAAFAGLDFQNVNLKPDDWENLHVLFDREQVTKQSSRGKGAASSDQVCVYDSSTARSLSELSAEGHLSRWKNQASRVLR